MNKDKARIVIDFIISNERFCMLYNAATISVNNYVVEVDSYRQKHIRILQINVCLSSQKCSAK